ncbi:MAG: ABC transporter substrate-binding protein, partial [Hyphomicrobiaceae bacterium]|nr:ABC transporter substrate-binding protein [Hyphomicrobiaceae bacterium]
GVAPYYAYPGFHEPNGTGEALIGASALASLESDLAAIVETVLAREAARALAEAEFANAVALRRLVETRGAELFAFPEDVLSAAKTAAEDVYEAFAARGADEAAVVRSYFGVRDLLSDWSSVSVQRYLAARG